MRYYRIIISWFISAMPQHHTSSALLCTTLCTRLSIRFFSSNQASSYRHLGKNPQSVAFDTRVMRLLPLFGLAKWDRLHYWLPMEYPARLQTWLRPRNWLNLQATSSGDNFFPTSLFHHIRNVAMSNVRSLPRRRFAMVPRYHLQRHSCAFLSDLIRVMAPCRSR